MWPDFGGGSARGLRQVQGGGDAERLDRLFPPVQGDRRAGIDAQRPAFPEEHEHQRGPQDVGRESRAGDVKWVAEGAFIGGGGRRRGT